MKRFKNSLETLQLRCVNSQVVVESCTFLIIGTECEADERHYLLSVARISGDNQAAKYSLQGPEITGPLKPP